MVYECENIVLDILYMYICVMWTKGEKTKMTDRDTAFLKAKKVASNRFCLLSSRPRGRGLLCLD